MITVNALGDVCPVPVVKTKQAIREMNGSGELEVLVDNEISVQNLEKMARQKGYSSDTEKLADQKYRVHMVISKEQQEALSNEPETEEICPVTPKGKKAVVISSEEMGTGAEQLGRNLMKAFLFALTQQDELPEVILFFNGGAHMTCEGSPALEDIKTLEAEGVEILTCGTCLDFYRLKESLAVGSVTNMYEIAERMLKASSVIRP